MAGNNMIWEEDHIKSATYKFGSKDLVEMKEKKLMEEILIEDEIEFVKNIEMPGTETAPKVQVPSEEKTLDEVRKSLPVYGFREGILRAIDEYQVLIIEGETGSGKTTQIPQYLYESVLIYFYF
ncbi:probable pre-mRNA-splicing factor ATP-dependent RNA helicase mog-4 [Octopus sinensis]|uniref:Probable pre-mRNA-splicing factor ATP-dependent RNA helicase mog-4 n=1 Tax=Octopus sinensis TaxID=2607531 RepID=A0A7E6EHX8_9MOLL|nr:probable pre-mRNA-splicing factor ATP-dependent RNA helicase mog-4 [Octopus sinensis]